MAFTGYKKSDLVQLAECASKLRLTDDPDLLNIDQTRTLVNRLASCGYKGTDPSKELKFENNFEDVPDIGLYDVFNYLIVHRADYDRKKLRMS